MRNKNRNKKMLAFVLLGCFVTSSMVALVSFLPDNKAHKSQDDGIQSSEVPAFNYAEALQKAIYFFKQQRSGDLPDNYDVIWRGDSCLSDGADVGVDLSKGYFDAGDYVKFNMPMAATMFALAVNVKEYEQTLISLGLYNEIIEAIRWGADYLVACHPSANVYHFQVGNATLDHKLWSQAEVVHKLSTRPTFTVTDNPAQGGPSVAAASATALLATSKILETEDPTYAALCLSKGSSLLSLAERNQNDTYYNRINTDPKTKFYPSYSGCYDELSMANCMMHLITGNQSYLDKAEAFSDRWRRKEMSLEWRDDWMWDWDDMQYIAKLYFIRESSNQSMIARCKQNLEYSFDRQSDKNLFTYTPGGKVHYLQWGSLRYAADAVNLAGIYSNDPNCPQNKVANYTNFVEGQIHYILGENPLDRCYIIGYGEDYGKNYPQYPHHRGAHGTWMNSWAGLPKESQHILYGALVGGPSAWDGDDHNDDRNDYIENEVTLDYNMGLIGALTFLAEKNPGNGGIIPDFPRDEDFKPWYDREKEYYCDAEIIEETSTELRFIADITNHASWPATILDQMSYRYYFDISELIATGYGIEDVEINIQNSEVRVIHSQPILESGTVYYFEVDYTGTEIYPGGNDVCAKETQMQIIHPPTWDSSNDHSYRFSSGRASNDYIPVYNARRHLGGINFPYYTYIDLPFRFDGEGEYFWVTDSIPDNINSWGLELLEINGVDVANRYLISGELPPQITGVYYIHYIGTETWSHFGTSGGISPSPPPGSGYEPITSPYWFNGVGEYQWVSDSIPDHINSWELELLEINGVDVRNQYLNSWELPATIDGKYYIDYIGKYPWSHFEAI